MPTLLPLWRYAHDGKQCGLAPTGDYQPSLRSPWLAAREEILVFFALSGALEDVFLTEQTHQSLSTQD